MTKKNLFTYRRKLDQQAAAWFDRIDDSSPFEAFSNEKEKIKAGQEILRGIRTKIKIRKLYRVWGSAAAAAIFFGVTSIIGYEFYQKPTSRQVEQVWENYTARRGEFKKITLPDRSVVHLRPGSKIAIPNPFVQATRQIRLEEGEAYFDVTHDPSHPFLVNAGKLTTKVLGTKFVISNNPFARDIKVVLFSGKVAVQSGKKAFGVLSPNQQISFNKANGIAKLEQITYKAETWLNGEYLLEDVSLRSFAETFGNAFSLDVKFSQKKFEELPISIQFNRADQPEAILDQLKLIHGLHYQIKGREVLLSR